MIYGIGTDILRIDRVTAALERHGNRFAERILGPSELVMFHQRSAKIEMRGVRFLATRFAAKEAFSKAIGLGMRMPMSWRAMEVSKLPSGKPGVLCHGALAEFMQANRLTAHVTLTDEEEYAVAFAVVEQG